MTSMGFPKVWDLINLFKDRCRSLGWKTSEIDDWVMCERKYHSFIWIRDVHPSTFVKLASKKRCIVQEGFSYRVVDASYTAWIFPQSPSRNLITSLAEDPQLSKRTAMYDLSGVYRGNPLCLKINKTDSIVFEEFENFLRRELGVRFELIGKEPPKGAEKTLLTRET